VAVAATASRTAPGRVIVPTLEIALASEIDPVPGTVPELAIAQVLVTASQIALVVMETAPTSAVATKSISVAVIRSTLVAVTETISM